MKSSAFEERLADKLLATLRQEWELEHLLRTLDTALPPDADLRLGLLKALAAWSRGAEFADAREVAERLAGLVAAPRGSAPDTRSQGRAPARGDTTLAERLAAHLQATGPDSRGYWRARCPWHEDTRPSFYFDLVWARCWACWPEGGPLRVVAARLGLPVDDPDDRRNGHRRDGQPPSPSPQRPASGSARQGWSEDAAFAWLRRKTGAARVMATGLGVRYEDGALCLTWPGFEARMVRPGPADAWRWEADDAEGRRPDLWPLAIFPPRTVWLTEGATDCLALRAAGLPAYASVKGAVRDLGRVFRALREAGAEEVVLAYDLDAAGRSGTERAAKAAAQAGLRVRCLELPPSLALAGGKDICDLLANLGGDARRLRETVEGLAQEGEGTPAESPGPSGSVSINTLSVETKRHREVRASDLQAQARTEGGTTLESLPVLSQEGFVFRRLSHLLAGFPKAGKTELLVRAVAEWRGEAVLWFTEEPESIWRARLSPLPDAYGHLTLYFALGSRREELLERIRQGQETVVILDTTKLLGLDDANDASEVTRVLTPFIATCREEGKTLILAHHERKGGGQHGEGIAGSHAFLGLVDVALELLWDDKSSKRRLLRGYGRVVAIPEMVYEMVEDGSLVPLGDPEALAMQAVKERALALLTEEWQTLRDIMASMGDPRPSEDQVRRALNALVEEGKAERDPPLGAKGNRAHQWRGRFGSVSTEQSNSRNETGPPTMPREASPQGPDGQALGDDETLKALGFEPEGDDLAPGPPPPPATAGSPGPADGYIEEVI